ncbi:MAG: lysylphosphatidylglycerol synthase transmembrane domain-containing protein [Actinomycetota bacterium]
MSTTVKEPKPKKRLSTSQLVAFAFGLIVVVAIFAFAIPRYADYGAVWASMKTLTPLEFWSLLAATIFNLYTYWLANEAGLIGMGLGQSAVVTQTSTSVANTLPAGGAFGVGVTAAMLNTWGFTAGEITLFIGVTGIWNIFVKLGLPIVALALLVITGHSNPGLVAGAVVGLIVLAIAVTLLVLVFRSERMARSIGVFVGRVFNAFRKLLRKPTHDDMGDKAVTFRRETIILANRRWFMLTWTTVLSQVALFLVLLLSLRHMGVAESELPTVEVFAVYTFSRLLSAIPITPGGVGMIDLGYIAGLTAIDSGEKAAIVAAVLIFRLLTYGLQIPLGVFTYVIYRRRKRWMRDTPPPGSIAAELEQSRVASATV